MTSEPIQYNFNIGDIFSEAWKKTDGLKGSFWAAFACIALITAATFMISYSIDGLIQQYYPMGDLAVITHPIAQILQILFSVFLSTPLFGGLLMLSIKHCAGEPIVYSSVFHYLKYWKQLAIYPIVVGLIGLVRSLLIDSSWAQFGLSLVMLYIIVTYIMFVPLVVDKQLNTWAALEASRKHICAHWFKTLWFIILLGLIAGVSGMLILIPLIWTLPMVYNGIAILYRNIFVTKTA